MGPSAGIDYNLILCHSRVDSNTFAMGGQPYASVDLNPVPESTLSPSQGRLICPLYSVFNGTKDLTLRGQH